jgi:DNA-binding transcriptional ArsR family regulator
MGECLQDQDLDRAFAALAHPTRRALLIELGAEEQRVTDLAARFPLALNSVSKHLRVLEAAGLVQRRIEGRDHWLAADWRPLSEALRWAEKQMAFWTRSLDALARLVEPADPKINRRRK